MQQNEARNDAWVEEWCRKRDVWPIAGHVLPQVDRYRLALLDLAHEAQSRAFRSVRIGDIEGYRVNGDDGTKLYLTHDGAMSHADQHGGTIRTLVDARMLGAKLTELAGVRRELEMALHKIERQRAGLECPRSEPCQRLRDAESTLVIVHDDSKLIAELRARITALGGDRRVDPEQTPEPKA